MPELNEPKKVAASTAVLAECDAIEADLAELRAAYEQYFLGLEKRPPTDKHNALRKRLLKVRGLWTRQTSAKFRVQSTASRFATYERLWQRTIQEIENGTYIRDLRRARRKQLQQQQAAKTVRPGGEVPKVEPEPLTDGAESLEQAMANAAAAVESRAGSRAPAAAPSAAPARAPVAPARAPVAPPASSQLSDEKLRAVYDAFVKAKKRCNEDTSGISYEQVASSLRKQIPVLMKQHKARSVEFKVVIKDGKAVLRAVPRSG